MIEAALIQTDTYTAGKALHFIIQVIGCRSYTPEAPCHLKADPRAHQARRLLEAEVKLDIIEEQVETRQFSQIRPETMASLFRP